MPIPVPLKLADEMPAVNRETCVNFIHFRNILRAHRSKCDDKIKQRLSSITNLKEQCPKFWDNLKKAQESRLKNLKSCLQVLKEESNRNSVLEKEVKFRISLTFDIHFICRRGF